MNDDPESTREIMIWMRKRNVDSLELPGFTDATRDELRRLSVVGSAQISDE
ncbi:hypothetical protein [Curtobacterium flaccumfaciens]|uniref:hypothetical protein n=1 Tax=Curtobacterium flaccumfaciens TaxID=2035 RepID=UPI0024A99BEE|nr:hypothetical protein [Curtobacterium flaccumfaciens]